MNLLNEDILKEFGFIESPQKNTDFSKAMSRDNIDLHIKNDGIYYSNMGFDYPLIDTAALKKLYKELKSVELKP